MAASWSAGRSSWVYSGWIGWPLSVENGASRSGEASKRSRSQRSTMDSSRSSRMGVAMGTV
jgi:hypothetical protein